MKHRHFLAAFLVVALASAALLFDEPVDEGLEPVETVPVTDAPELAEDREALVAIAPAQGPAEPSDRHELEGESAVTGEPATPDDVASRVRIAIEDQVWLDPETSEGTVLWNGDLEGAPNPDEDLYEFQFEFVNGELVGEAVLPSVPKSHKEFTAASIADLSLQPIALHPTTQGDSDFELRMEWVQGATLVWSSSVPSADQKPVNVAIGGSMEPLSRTEHPYAKRDGLIQVRHGLELPLVLPKLVVDEPVWVGADGYRWRSFPVTPEELVVEVALSRAAALRVLYDPPATQGAQHVFAKEFPRGNSEKRPVAALGEAEFHERPATVHQVWVAETADPKSQRVSRLARLTLTQGETSIVDLTSEYATKHLGGLRLRVHASPETLKLAKGGLTVRASKPASANAMLAWGSAGLLSPVDTPENSGGVFELLGAEPGPHRLIVEPFGTRITEEVLGGEIRDVDVYLDNFGWVQVVRPDGFNGPPIFGALKTSEIDPRNRSWIHLKNNPDWVDGQPRPIAIGKYIVSETFFVDGQSSILVSDVFEVQNGKTTEVELRHQPRVNVKLVAHDMSIDEPVALDLNFWFGVKAVSTLTGLRQIGSISYTGTGDRRAGIEWELPEIDEPVEIEIPESPFWEFERIEPLRLTDGATLVLRVRPK